MRAVTLTRYYFYLAWFITDIKKKQVLISGNNVPQILFYVIIKQICLWCDGTI